MTTEGLVWGSDVRKGTRPVILPKNIGLEAVVGDIDIDVAIFIKVSGRNTTARLRAPGPHHLE